MKDENASIIKENEPLDSSKQKKNLTQGEKYQEKLNLRKRIVESSQKILHSLVSQNPVDRLREALAGPDLQKAKSEVLSIQRSYKIDQKMLRVSANTMNIGRYFLTLSEPMLEGKTVVIQFQNEMSKYRNKRRPETDSTNQEIVPKKKIMFLRHALQHYHLLRNQAIKLYTTYTQKRIRDFGEEQTLQEAIRFYLKFVDSQQRGKLETRIKEKTGGMPFENRIDSFKLFIETLMLVSPSIKRAEVDRMIVIARHFLSLQQTDAAIGELEKANQYLNQPEIHLVLADCWDQKNDPHQVIESLQKALDSDSSRNDISLRLAQYYERTGRFSNAISHYYKLLISKPLYSPILPHAAQLAFDHEEWSVAIALWSKYLKRKPQSKNALKCLSISLIESQEVERGIEILLKLIKGNPEDGVLHMYIGIAYRSLGHFKDAHHSFKTAIQFLPNDTTAAYWLTVSLMDGGEYEEAEQQCRALLRNHEYGQEVMPLFAQLLYKTGKYEEIISMLKPMMGDTGEGTQWLAMYGKTCLKCGNANEAYAVLRKVVTPETEDEEVRQAFGLACIECGRFEESLPYL